MSEPGRSGGIPVAVGLLLLAATVGGTAWWLTRPTANPTPSTVDPHSFDVVCTGRVDAAGTVVALEPPQAGRVVSIAVKEGDAVTRGQEVLRLDDSQAKVRLAQAEAAVELATLEVETATKDKDRFPQQIAAKEQLLKAAAARVEAAQKAFKQRMEQQQVTPLSVPEREAMQAQIRELEAYESAEKIQVEELKKTDPELRLKVARPRLRSAEADKELADRLLKDMTLRAPGDGTILRLQTTPGGYLSPGLPVPAVVFAPAGPLVVRAEVEQEFLARVKPGMKATIQDENRPDAPTWPGHVASVSRWVAMRRTLVFDPGEVNDIRTVECVVEFDPPVPELWLGQRVRVRVSRSK